MKSTRADLQTLLQLIAKKSNLSTTEQGAIDKGQETYLQLEYNGVWGGYKVVNVVVGTFAHRGAFGGNGTEGRLKAKEMVLRLKSILDGIDLVVSK